MRFALIFIVFVPCFAFAAGYGGAHGTNEYGETIYFSEKWIEIEGKSRRVLMVSVSYTQKNAGQEEPFDFVDECTRFHFEEKEIRISCRKNSKSPLAGTTYRETTSKEYNPCRDDDGNYLPPDPEYSGGTVYECIEGCDNPRAPKIFYEQPWEECSDL